MGDKRAAFCGAATEALRKRMEPKGISVDSVMLMTAYPAAETQDKINRRINQYTEYEIALLRGQIAEVSRKTNVVLATANTEATRITAATAKDQGLSQLRLQADGEAIEKWDGHLPEIRSGAGQTLVLDGAAMGNAVRQRLRKNREKTNETPSKNGTATRYRR